MRGGMRTDQSQSAENSHPDTPSFRQNLTFFQKAVQIGSGARRSDAASSSTSTIVGSGARLSDGRRSVGAPARRSSISSDDSSAQSFESQEEESSFDLPPPPVAFSGVGPRPVTSEQAASRIGRDSVTSVAACRPAVGGKESTDPARAVRVEKGSRVRIGGTASERIKSGGKHRSQQASVSQTQEEFVREDRPSRISSAVEDEVQLPRRKPYIRFNSVEKSLNHDDLTYFKQTIGIVPGTELSITRTQSCNEGLDQQTVRTSSSTGVSRTLSYSSLAEAERREGATGSGRGSSLKRVPSVDEILESVKALRARRQEVGDGSGREMVKTTAEPEAEYQNLEMKRVKTGSSGARMTSWSNTKFQNPSYRVVEDPDEGYENIPPGELCYENLSRVQSSAEVIYDQPVSSRLRKHQGSVEPEQPTYMNLSATDAAEMLYENVEKGSVSISGNGMVTSAQYDVPRTASHIYDSPQKSSGRVRQQQLLEPQLEVEATYDTPRTARGHRGSAGHHRLTQIQINGETELSQSPDLAECDRDSLEGTSPRAPDIPSPDYASDGDQDVDGIPDDYVGDDQLDEGLGESDARSYYNEDPAGLEVILEEPEDEYVTSSEEEEESHRPNRSLGSLDGSEGIGSAEGDSGSNASVESSSGVHSTEGSPTLHTDTDKEDRVQKDRCVEVYPETMRQRKHSKKPKPIDIKQWKETSDAVVKEDIGSKTLDNPARAKKLLPSVKALKSQFEPSPGVEAPARGTKSSRTPASGKERAPAPPKRTQSPDDHFKNISAGETLVARKDTSPRGRGQGTAGKPAAAPKQLTSPISPSSSQPTGRASSKHQQVVVEAAVDPIFDQFSEVDERLLRPGIATLKWNPTPLVNRLYELPDPARRSQGQEKGYINIEGWLEKLPSGRKKATFWNAWKRRYFKAKDGYLYYYQSNTTEKPSMVLQLMGGHVELSDNSVIGVDDGKGHYVVVRCSNEQESERWSRALLSHTVEDFSATYIQPVSPSAAPSISRRCVVIDLGSSSIRAGVLHGQPTLPKLFMPAVMTTSRDGQQVSFGRAALRAETRAAGSLCFPLRPSSRITKYSVDVAALEGLLRLVFGELRVDPSQYDVQLSLPRSFNTATLARILGLLFDTFGARGVNLTHQSILAMWSYNATSGVVVDIGDRMDVVPVIDGYIVEGGVSRVPYGGSRIQEHLRHFLLQKRYSLNSEIETFIIRFVMENVCFVAERYSEELQRFHADPQSFEKAVSVKEFLGDNASWRRMELDCGRFQSTEGLFSPDAWGLDSKGVHKLVHKAVQECSVDIRKEMVKSIYLAGGVTLLPGFAERLQTEMDKLTPPSVTPKVHASPYRYHAAYLGACVLAASDGFQQAKVSRDSWNKMGASALNKWTV